MRLHKSLVAGAAITAALSLGQSRASADEAWMAEPTQATNSPGTTTEYVGPDTGLFFGGLFLFGAPYVASAIVAANSTHVGDNNLYIPVAGPWIDLAQRGGCPVASPACVGAEGTNQVLLIGNGVLQGIGAIAFIASFLAPETEQVPNSVAKAHSKWSHLAKEKPTINFTPISFRGGSGLAAFGTF